MKYLLVSDTHGNRSRLEELLAAGDYDGFIHLGDGIAEAEQTSGFYPEKIFIGVCGNCDFSAGEPVERVSRVRGVPVFICHGHKYGVKGGLVRLAAAAAARGCRAAFYGHTHAPCVKMKDGVLLVNPGTLGYCGEYAVITVIDGEIIPELKKM
ncbi:MAG: metallophosphoesterase family protein [Clostridia bacterium]|nr:metallophosphoesterase family protein [Clostridia bacterium]